MVPGRAVHYAGLAIGAAALLFALLPFTTSHTLVDVAGPYPSTAVSCGPPIAEATHPPPHDSGWFGYAPLTSTPSGFPARPCYEPARDRLVFSVAGLFVAAVLGWFTARVGPPRGRRWRHRMRRRPAQA